MRDRSGQEKGSVLLGATHDAASRTGKRKGKRVREVFKAKVLRCELGGMMSQYLIFVCDHCKKESRTPHSVKLVFPVPTGHPSRADCKEYMEVELCKECHESLNYWWKMEVPPCP